MRSFTAYVSVQMQSGIGETQLTMKFSFQMGGRHVNVVSAVRTFVAPNRTVVTFTSLLAPVASGLLFRENSWFVMSDSSASPPSSASLFQTCYRLHLEKRDLAAATSPNTANLCSVIMNGQSEKMRAYQMKIQNMLLHDLNSIASGGRLGACSLRIECGT